MSRIEEGSGSPETDPEKTKVCFEGVGTRLFFSLKRTGKFKKAMAMFCKQAKCDIKDTKFTFEGNPVKDSDTPIQIGLGDSDVINVSLNGDGGSYYIL